MAISRTHVLGVPLSTATARMPAAVRASGGDIALQRREHGTAWRWNGAGGGVVTLSTRSTDRTSMTITADCDRATVADELAVALYGVLERQWAPPAPAAAGARPLSKVLVAVVAVLVPLLAVTGSRLVAAPAPLDVAAAVTQFREGNPQEPSAADQPATRAGGRRKAAPRNSQRTAAGAKSPAPRRQQRETAPATRVRARSTAATRTPGAGTRAPAQRDRRTAAAPAAASNNTGRQQDAGRQAPAKQEQPAARAPEPGVYRYATDGYESIDKPSSRHDYPKETATTIQATDCGFALRWQPLENRWDEMSVCNRDGGKFIAGMGTHREFYGQQNETSYECTPGTYAFRPQAGATWTGRCADGEAKLELRGRTVGRETVQVGNETLEALHFVIEGRLSGGDAEGTWTANRWVDPNTGLLFRLEAQTSATSSSSIGTVQYQERLSLRLLSPTPQR